MGHTVFRATFAPTPSTTANLSAVLKLNLTLGEEMVVRFMWRYEEESDVQDDPS